jgi:hypothetical protein
MYVCTLVESSSHIQHGHRQRRTQQANVQARKRNTEHRGNHDPPPAFAPPHISPSISISASARAHPYMYKAPRAFYSLFLLYYSLFRKEKDSDSFSRLIKTRTRGLMSKRKADVLEKAPPSTGKLDGKVILVTGGAQGMGLEVVRLAASLGARGLCVVDRNCSRRQEVQDEVAAAGAECLFVECDVAIPEQIKAAVASADKRFGRIDGLVNCVGDTRRGTLESTDVQLWE